MRKFTTENNKNKTWCNVGLILPIVILWVTSPTEIYAQSLPPSEPESQTALLLIRDAINDIRSEISALRSDIREDIKSVNARVDSIYNLMLGGLITIIITIVSTQWWTRIKPKENTERTAHKDEEYTEKDFQVVSLRHLLETESQKAGSSTEK